MAKELCYGCKHLTTAIDGAGFCSYGCAMSPGVIIGVSDLWDDDAPIRCSHYQLDQEDKS